MFSCSSCRLLFMASGMAAATISNSAAAAGIAPVAAQLVWPHSDVLRFGLLLLCSAVLTLAALAGIAKQVSDAEQTVSSYVVILRPVVNHSDCEQRDQHFQQVA
jgi:hypothetical protein